MIVDKMTFFYKFLKSPKRVGSVTPSSIFLANAMLKNVDWENTQSIVELGAGTGAFTRLIQQNKKSSTNGIIYEQDTEMRLRLERLFPEMSFHSSAENLFEDIRDLGLEQVDCILSGLPFANFSQTLRDRIIDAVVQSLRPGGTFIAFQYSRQMLPQLEKHFSDIDVSFVPLNIPPAFVYLCTK
ncbi:class I SAM-dependent methyltransferase [Ammoniphilus resinae]|uniref:Phospholipid N-methyltransferase n=1 Tax=Ammoniphilus resinae TaxID=861532 RepID=A0ABS4GLS6_9BACL|nr:methyltransferase [Ammoniphilus resinae]MBP1931206.1 phospholipid N-methyltransferase [Ammoniphilus resinae]